MNHSLSSLPANRGAARIQLLMFLIFVVVVVVLAFPVFRPVQEDGQNPCFIKLQQIAMAVKQYKLDEGHYPQTLLDISPYIGVSERIGHPRSLEEMRVPHVNFCPEDDTFRNHAYTSNQFAYSSYYDTNGGKLVWNYWGYRSDGFAYSTDEAAYKGLLRKSRVPSRNYPRLANRFTPDYTIITHCIHHRRRSGRDPYQQLDTVVRLSGHASTVHWKTYDWVTQPD